MCKKGIQVIMALCFMLLLTSPRATGATLPQVGERDTTVTPALYISSGLIVTGLYINSAGNGTLKSNLQEYLRHRNPDFRTNLDDYLQWLPGVEMGLANVAGIPSLHKSLHQAMLYTISVTANALFVEGVKAATGVTRPNGGNHSFPSGHTSNAFVNATVLYLEYRDKNQLLAWSGFLAATTTGVLRVMNNAHWVSDIVAGAGVGILVPLVVYAVDPFRHLFHHTPVENVSGFSVMVIPTPQGMGLSLNLSF